MNPGKAEVINPNSFKGFVPNYMKQGIPPFLQVLFAARAPLPYIAPMKRGYRRQFKGYFEQLDYAEIFKKVEEKREKEGLDQKAENEEDFFLKKSVQIENPHTIRLGKWKRKMTAHLQKQKEAYRKWVAEEKMNDNGKTKNPRNTLVVSNLVSSQA